MYRAKAGDLIGTLAEQWGVEIAGLLANNTATIESLDAPLTGKLLSVCGVSECCELWLCHAPATSRHNLRSSSMLAAA